MMSYYYQFFGWILKVIYNFVGSNYALALILFTLFFRIILLPSTISQQKGAAKQMRMQSKIKRIQEKYKDYQKPDKQQKIQQEQQELYQNEGFSSMTGGCLPLLIQLPVMWGLYGAVYRPLKYILGLSDEILTKFVEAYNSIMDTSIALANRGSQAEMLIMQKMNEVLAKCPDTPVEVVEKIKNFNFTVFGIPLYATPSFNTFKNLGSATTEEKLLLLIPILAFLTSLLTSVYTQVRQKKTNPGAAQMKSMGCMMIFMMPAMSLWITSTLPAAVGMYWIISNIIAFVQMFVLGFTHDPKKVLAKLMVEETIERRSRERNIKNAAKNLEIEN